MKVDAVIQARMGSTRLPNKMVYSLHGKPIIEWVIDRVRRASRIDRLVLATSTAPENDILEAEAKRLGTEVFRGDENDVLGRFYEATKDSDASHIVRICADNPLIWGPEIDNLIEYMKANPCDYAYNHIPRNNKYPDGLGAEIVPSSVLRRLHKTVTDPAHREHIFSYIWDNPDKFDIRTFDPPNFLLQHPNIRLDIDKFEDYYHIAKLAIDITSSAEDIIRIITEGKSRS